MFVNNSQMLKEKNPAEELYAINQKRIQNIVGGFMYFERAVDPKMLLALNCLEVV